MNSEASLLRSIRKQIEEGIFQPRSGLELVPIQALSLDLYYAVVLFFDGTPVRVFGVVGLTMPMLMRPDPALCKLAWIPLPEDSVVDESAGGWMT